MRIAVLQSTRRAHVDGVCAGVLRHSNLTSSHEASPPSLVRVEDELTQLVNLVNGLCRKVNRAKKQQVETQRTMRQLVESQTWEMRHVVETLVTQVNDISRTLTESSRSQSRWM